MKICLYNPLHELEFVQNESTAFIYSIDNVQSVRKLGRHCKMKPRSQAFHSTRGRGGKTLVQAGHMSSTFWEITKIHG